MPCEMCGKQVEDSELFYSKIEGSIIKVCEGCKDFGIVLKRVAYRSREILEKKQSIMPKLQPEEEEMVIENYAEVIKNAREKKGIKQEDFAKMINEKDSLVHKIETGHMEPSIELARKIEKFLTIHLVEQVKMQAYEKSYGEKKTSDELTVGDIIKIKKR